ncbi:uncharacterized protein LOC129370213 [Poeciliopsis prolifica]|uniref:uncharacterized protein LOC129370213 n=1 Tax=Poeciliopsis prolifica TaxID=188132 RepID=UPI0024135E7D|nr:uncharacterized protein LOC129370213 [Poeciliopsis prolifica]XP_054902086.1 uncharacterized protein LOC129370213 [Poeciliopsis prolifica]
MANKNMVFVFALCFHLGTTHVINETSYSCSTANGIRMGIQVCFPPRSTITVLVPWESMVSENYRDYTWYMTNDVFNTGWETLVADEGNKWTRDWGTTTYAQHQKQILSISRTDEGIRIGINTATHPLFPPSARKKKPDATCWEFYLWAFTSGADPKFLTVLCEESKEGGGSATSPWTVGVKVKEVETIDDWFKVNTGVSGQINNWLLMVEQAAKMAKQDCVVCMESRPLLHVTPAIISEQCLLEVMSKTNPNSACVIYDSVFPLAAADEEKPFFSKKVAPGNFSCVNITGSGKRLGSLSGTMCATVLSVNNDFNPVSRADVWWWCGDDRIFDRLPRNVAGLCALVSLLLPVSVYPMSAEHLTHTLTSIMPQQWHHLQKRELTWKHNDATYIDAIGVPPVVPDEYKLTHQTAAGFESTICWWCSVNKSVDRINFIHFNVQKLGNRTQAGFEAVHEQLATTSLMAFQNRIASDMLLAELVGVCAIFRGRCCTFLPNNIAADGSLTKAIVGLRTLNGKMKELSGVNTSMWDEWMNVFGKYRTLVSSVLVSMAVFVAIVTLCGCCCIPCLRSLLNRLISTAISPMKDQMTHMYPLLAKDPEADKEYSDEDSSDLYPDPNFWAEYHPKV